MDPVYWVALAATALVFGVGVVMTWMSQHASDDQKQVRAARRWQKIERERSRGAS